MGVGGKARLTSRQENNRNAKWKGVRGESMEPRATGQQGPG